MSRTGEFILVVAVVTGVALFAATHVTCWHIPYVVNSCTIR